MEHALSRAGPGASAARLHVGAANHAPRRLRQSGLGSEHSSHARAPVPHSQHSPLPPRARVPAVAALLRPEQDCALRHRASPHEPLPRRVTVRSSSGTGGPPEGGTSSSGDKKESGPVATQPKEGEPAALTSESSTNESADKSGPAEAKAEGQLREAHAQEPEKPKPEEGAASSQLPPGATVQFQSFSVSDLLGPEKVDLDDVKLFREKLCGYSSFFVTGQEPFGETGEGVLLTGNMRGVKEEVYARLKSGMATLFGDKYELFMVREPNSGADAEPVDESRKGQVRVSLVLVRKEAVNAPSPGAWQYVIALVLLGVTAGSCLELGLATQISKIPPEVLRYFTAATPEAGGDPPALETLTPFVQSALPVAYGVLGIQLFHELGHFLAAKQRQVRLGVPFLIPNITIGSFGAITQFLSPCPDRSAKFDVAVAGVVAGGALSLAMFLVGLSLTAVAQLDPAVAAESGSAAIQGLAAEDLVKVPSLLFQGSLLLGLLSRASLGYDTLHAATVAVHPLLITGWCGLTVTALNLLPVGTLDGGRAMQAAFGRTPTVYASTVTYILLALGLIGGTISLPFGLYVLLLQRNLEKPCLNDVTEVSAWRKGVAAALLLLALGILLPVWDSLAESTGIGLESIGSIMI